MTDRDARGVLTVEGAAAAPGIPRNTTDEPAVAGHRPAPMPLPARRAAWEQLWRVLLAPPACDAGADASARPGSDPSAPKREAR